MINKVMVIDENLLEEKRELLHKVREAENMSSNNLMTTATTLQHRANLLEVENRHLEDRILKLSSQVSTLQRKLRNTQTDYNMENTQIMHPSDGIPHTSMQSQTPRSFDPSDILDKVCCVRMRQRVVVDSNQAYVSTDACVLSMTSARTRAT